MTAVPILRLLLVTLCLLFSAKRRFSDAARPVHLHAVGQLLCQVDPPERTLAGNSRVAAVGQKARQERTQKRNGPLQSKGDSAGFITILEMMKATVPLELLINL